MLTTGQCSCYGVSFYPPRRLYTVLILKETNIHGASVTSFSKRTYSSRFWILWDFRGSFGEFLSQFTENIPDLAVSCPASYDVNNFWAHEKGKREL